MGCRLCFLWWVGLQGFVAGMGGVFEVNTAPTTAQPLCVPCASPNTLTGACSCPAGAEFVQTVAIVNDCVSGSLLRPGYIGICVPGHLDPSFGGAFQQAEDGLCLSLNRFTMDCSCPSGFSLLTFGLLAPAGFPGEGRVDSAPSTLSLCVASQRPPSFSFGGAFQADDPVPGGEPCRVPNPLTGDCSCAVGTVGSSMRVILGVPPGLVGSHITVCSSGTGSGNGSDVDSREDHKFGLNMVTICPGVNADNTGSLPAAKPLQTCLDSIPEGGRLLIPAGTYSIETTLQITKGLFFGTLGIGQGQEGCGRPNSAACAVLQASVGLSTPFGVVFVNSARNVVLDHLVLDGNRGARINTPAGASCGGENRAPGYTSAIHNCDGCAFLGSVAMNALCGTGLEFFGDRFLVVNSSFLLNGDHFGHNTGSSQNSWADGLTLNTAPNAIVMNNYFQDNSDINLIIGGGTSATLQSNLIVMVVGAAFGGIMLDNFNSGPNGNFTNASVQNNRISCMDRCHFGMEIGPHPWYESPNIFGGVVTQNFLSGAAVLLDVSGGGIPTSPITVMGNVFGSGCTPGVEFLFCKKQVCLIFNVDPDSTINRRGETVPVPSTLPLHQCV